MAENWTQTRHHTTAIERVNSFLTGGGARKSDADLWSKAKGAKKKKKESYEIGKDYGDHTRKVTLVNK